jgi:hypothetical protein
MYARGILFGKMKYELGDHSFVRCPENDLAADIEFKTKGWVGGIYNAISGVIKKESTQEVLFELSGMWNGEMFAKDAMVSLIPVPIRCSILTGHRAVIRNCFSMLHMPSPLLHEFGLWMNCRKENLPNFGVT